MTTRTLHQYPVVDPLDPRYKARPVADDECGNVHHPDGSWHHWEDFAPWWRPLLRWRQRRREDVWGCQCPRDPSVVHRG